MKLCVNGQNIEVDNIEDLNNVIDDMEEDGLFSKPEDLKKLESVQKDIDNGKIKLKEVNKDNGFTICEVIKE